MNKASTASANGLSVTVHAIGDKANHDVLDVFEAVRKREAKAHASGAYPKWPKLRHRIEHVQIIHPADQHRLAQLDVIASMQPHSRDLGYGNGRPSLGTSHQGQLRLAHHAQQRRHPRFWLRRAD